MASTRTLLLVLLATVACARAGEAGPVPLDRLWNYEDVVGSEHDFAAAAVAAEAAGDGERAAQAQTQRARAQGLLMHFVEADRTLDQVESTLAQRSPTTRVRYLLERGRVRNSAGEPAVAKPLFEQAWEAARAIGDDDLACDAAHMLAMAEIGGVDARIWETRLTELAESSSDPHAHDWLGPLYNNSAWDCFAAGDFDRALALQRKCLAFHLERHHVEPARVARWSIARFQRARGQVEEALKLQREIQAELEAAGRTDGFVFEELGECLLALGRGDEARPWFAKAVAEAARDHDFAEEVAPRLNRLEQLADE